ncbi:hypothetical protein, conserved [Trypanosoma cruzi]|uniref:Uncharacterized protein n=3 Tax=Trypanosoma cruzi TaxID=5693 RepID=Q4CZQ6_TRYCC|nr:hypothetical protein, conserved [Trypanosoma cruzi]EAN85760.1 hypothetical protein, conserved [Trypanosoma cruzi]|eukprot:XP_807611.1 hypothetical protein [Trypanosoma cruzi strain CL Brener]
MAHACRNTNYRTCWSWMPTIVIDGLTIRLASELQNTFNPSYAFGCREHGSSLALQESSSGHLLLPFDAEGNVIVTPGSHYRLVLVKEQKTVQETSDSPLPQQHRRQQDSKQQPKEVQAAAAAIGPKTKTTVGNGKHAEENGKAEEAAGESHADAAKKRQGRKRKNEAPAEAEVPTAAPQPKEDRKEAPRDDKSDKSDDVPLYRTFGNNQTFDVAATTVPPAVAAHRNGSPTSSRDVVYKSPKGHAATAASSIPDQSDDDNVPLSTSYAKKKRRQEKQAPAPDAATVPLTGVEKPLSRRQTKPPRRAPVATPSTSESD